MVDKITLTQLANVQATTTGITQINSNFSTIQTAFDNTLSRDGTSPNQMGTNLDMNSNRVINLAAPVSNNDAARLVDIGTAAIASTTATAAAAAASASATASAASATSAASSSTTAGTSSTNAATSATNASTSATNAAASAVTAANTVGGNLYQFDTSTTMALPATGFLRFNNATFGSVTALALNAQTADSGNPNIDAWLATWAASTNTVKGYIQIRKQSAPANFLVFTISAVTNNTTWVQITVAVIASNGSFSASDNLIVQFTRTGDSGSGVTGQTNHNVVIAASASTLGTGVTLTNGQFLVGATSADPTARTLSGDVSSVTATGAVTLSGVNGVTYPSSGTQGGIPYYSSNVATASSAALNQYGLVYGGGTAAAPSATAAGTNGQIPVGQTSVAPTWQTVSGDATLSAGGALTVTNNAITNNKLNTI